MDSTEHPANQRKQSQQIDQRLYELQLSVTNFLCTYVNIFQGRMETLQDLSYIQEERLRRLNWRNPGESEQKTISFLLRNMKELLQNESLCGRETLPYQLLMEVLHNLWTYFRFNGGVRAASTSRCHDQEWDEIALSNTIKDCERVAQIVQQQTALLQQNKSHEEDISRLNDPLGRILRYLKLRTIRHSQLRDAQTTSHDEDKALEELDWVLR